MRGTVTGFLRKEKGVIDKVFIKFDIEAVGINRKQKFFKYIEKT